MPGVAELLRPSAPGPDGDDQRRASGREKHTQKITVYLSADELVDLERARVALLRHGITADRGRIVREAIAVLLADLDTHGRDSLLARRIANNPDQNSPGANSPGANSPDQNSPGQNSPGTNSPDVRDPDSNSVGANGANRTKADGNGIDRVT